MAHTPNSSGKIMNTACTCNVKCDLVRAVPGVRWPIVVRFAYKLLKYTTMVHEHVLFYLNT